MKHLTRILFSLICSLPILAWTVNGGEVQTHQLVCPGGGYGMLVTGPEGHGIAQWLNRSGITGIVLEYRLPRGNYKVPLADVQRALRMVRYSASDWKINPGRIGIAGFSAGGHLASTAATHFDSGEQWLSEQRFIPKRRR